MAVNALSVEMPRDAALLANASTSNEISENGHAGDLAHDLEPGDSADETRCNSFSHRFIAQLLGPKIVTVSLWLETSILLYLMIFAWCILYLDLIQLPLNRFWYDLSFDVAVFLSCIMLCGSLVFYILGAVLYGRLYARRLTFLAALICNVFILCALLSFHVSYEVYLYLVPLACSCRLLINHGYNYKRKVWYERSPVRQRNAGLTEMLSAIDAVLDVSRVERKVLKDAAKDVDRCRRPARTNGLQTSAHHMWSSNEIHRFIRTAEVALTGAAPGLQKLGEVHRVDQLLIDLMNTVGGCAAKARNYGVLAATRSSLRHLSRGQLLLLLLFCSLSLLDAILVSVVQTWLVSRLVTAATVGDTANARSHLMAYLGSYVLDAGTNVLQSYTSAICLAAAVAHLQKRVACGMLSMGAQEHSLYPSGSVNATFSSDIARVDALLQTFCWAVLAPMMRIVVALIYTLCLKPQAGVLALTVFPLIFKSIPQARSSAAAAVLAKTSAATISMFQNGVACQRMIWMCDHQREWLHRFLGPLIMQQKRGNFGSKFMAGLVQAYAEQLVTIFVGVHIAIFAWLAVEGAMTVAEFTAMMSLFLTLSNPIKALAGFFRTAVSNAGSAQRLDEFIQETSSAVALTRADAVNLDQVHAPDGLQKLSNICSSSFCGHEACALKMQDISFTYPNTDTEVLKSVSLQIKAGEFVAMVGESGCGKTTLLSLMMTWLKPNKGTMVLNDSVLVVVPGDATFHFDISMQMRRLRDQIAVVFQDTMLLNGTVHDNIAFGAPVETTRSDVEWAAHAAGITDYITSLPSGFDTELGGAGDVSLSGGQAQRVCIARALCRKPKLLLLDEATSALDPDTESHILQTISSMRRNYPVEFSSLVVVCATHHPDTLKHADVVIRMAAGAVHDIERPTSQRQVWAKRQTSW